MAGLAAGTLTNKVEFQQKSEYKDASGQLVVMWETILTKNAFLDDVSIDTQPRDNANYAVSQLKVVCRYSANLQNTITTKHRLLLKGKAYRIDEISDFYTRQQISFLVSLYE